MVRLPTFGFLRGSFVASGFILAIASPLAQAQTSAPKVVHPNAQLASPQIERRVNDLLKKMTLEEKIGQLVQYPSAGTKTSDKLPGTTRSGEQLDAMQLAEQGRIGSLLNVGGAERVTAYQRAAVEKSRLHIPLLVGADVLHGYRTGFPLPLGMAASFDLELVTALSRMSAQEATPSGIRWFFAPMVDISRDARWGRTAEGAGEDAFLGSAMARAYVRGYQGNSLNDPQSVAVSVKHFAAYGAAEAGRDYNTTDMSISRLHQDYLPPYKAAVEAGAATLMSSFNALNGVPATANSYLMDTVLRKQWGFDGFVVSDDRAVGELINHGVALDRATAAEKALKAGVEVDMRSHVYDAELPDLVRSGRVPVATVDEAVRRILRVKFALGLFENPYPVGTEVNAAVPQHRELVRRAAEESFVLLQNKSVNGNPALPLRANAKIALIGPMADTRDVQGAWGGGRGEDSITVRAGLEEWAAAHGGSVTYVRGSGGNDVDSTSEEGFAAAEEAARQADVVVMVMGESSGYSGEAASRAHIDLPGNQQQLIDRIAAVGKPIVMVLFSGRPLVLTPVVPKVDALMEIWFPGTEAGHALARVLYGEVSPSGKLPMSFPQTLGQLPLYYNQLPTGRPLNPNPAPGSETHWVSRYRDAPNAALFPFGFGLSYAQFGYSNVTISRPSLPIREAVRGAKTLVTATTTVTNTGKVSATEVVQCYVGNLGTSLEQPMRSLKGFTRVTLAPGESKQISFPLGFEELSFFDNNGRQLIEPSLYNVWIGGDSLAASHAEFHITR